MASLGSWLTENWFPLVQGGGIICGLLFNAISIRRDTEARRTTDLLALSERHHELWAELNRRPDLQRVMSRQIDLLANPITGAETAFLRLVFVHFYTGWLLAKRGALVSLRALAADVRSFFTLPLPSAVWKETREGRDAEFVTFVESCLSNTRKGEGCL